MHNLNLIDKAFLLKTTPLFSSLDLDLLLTIGDKMEWVHYLPDSFVFQSKQDANRMYLVVSGQIEILDERGSQLAQIEKGEYFGDEALFGNHRRTYSAQCKTKVDLLALSGAHLIRIINECPSIALSILEAYASNGDFRKR